MEPTAQPQDGGSMVVSQLQNSPRQGLPYIYIIVLMLPTSVHMSIVCVCVCVCVRARCK